MNETGFHNTTISEKGTDTSYSILATVGLTGRVHGYLMMQSDTQSATSFIQELSSYIGIDPPEENGFGDFHKSTICEIINQITGRATILLSDIDLDSDITPPSVIVGSSIYSSISDFDTSANFYINDKFGTFKIFIGINII